MRFTRNLRRAGLVAAVAVLAAAAVALGAQLTAEQVAADMEAASRMRQLGQALLMYCNDNKGCFPPDLGLLDKYLRSKTAAERARQDYVYTPAPGTRLRTIKQPAAYAVAMTRPDSPTASLVVLFADGHVQAYVPMSRDAEPQAPPAPKPVLPATAPAAAAADSGAVPPGDVAKAIVGAWQTSAGLHDATYQFNADGTFTLTFVPHRPSAMGGYNVAPGSGTAGGTWRFDNGKLIMKNQRSDTAFTVAGETEEADVVSVSPTQLQLDTTNRKGQPERVTLMRVVPFEKGKHDNPHIAGTWNGSGMTLVLADSGMAVFGPAKGEWAQQGNKLVLSLPDGGGGGGGRSPRDGRAATGGMFAGNIEFTIDLVNDTTLVLSPATDADRARIGGVTLTLLRVK